MSLRHPVLYVTAYNSSYICANFFVYVDHSIKRQLCTCNNMYASCSLQRTLTPICRCDTRGASYVRSYTYINAYVRYTYVLCTSPHATQQYVRDVHAAHHIAQCNNIMQYIVLLQQFVPAVWHVAMCRTLVNALSSMKFPV